MFGPDTKDIKALLRVVDGVDGHVREFNDRLNCIQESLESISHDFHKLLEKIEDEERKPPFCPICGYEMDIVKRGGRFMGWRCQNDLCGKSRERSHAE